MIKNKDSLKAKVYNLAKQTNIPIKKQNLKNAIFNTSKARETLDYINNASKYIELINDDSRLKSLWNSYQNNYEYAKGIEFVDTINAIKEISEIIVSVGS